MTRPAINRGDLCLWEASPWADSARQDSIERLQLASDVVHEIMSAPDKGIPEEVLDNAKCIAVVPRLIKGGFIFGGKHGRGVAMCRTPAGWSAPAFISVAVGSFGLQIGAEGVDLVMLIMNEKGMQQLLTSKFQISGEGPAAAGPVGRHASAGTDWKLDTEMLTYSRSKGAFAGLTLEGAVVRQDSDSTIAIYGKDVPFRSILLGKVSAPADTRAFLQSVSDASRQARVQEVRQGAKVTLRNADNTNPAFVKAPGKRARLVWLPTVRYGRSETSTSARLSVDCHRISRMTVFL